MPSLGLSVPVSSADIVLAPNSDSDFALRADCMHNKCSIIEYAGPNPGKEYLGTTIDHSTGVPQVCMKQQTTLFFEITVKEDIGAVTGAISTEAGGDGFVHVQARFRAMSPSTAAGLSSPRGI